MVRKHMMQGLLTEQDVLYFFFKREIEDSIANCYSL